MRHVLLALLVLLLAVPARAEDAPRDYDTEKDAYKAWLERPSLYMRHKGRVEFARTKDVRAFRVLAKSYTKPEKPKDQVRYLLASICGDHFREPAHLDTWRGWRNSGPTPCGSARKRRRSSSFCWSSRTSSPSC